MDGDFKGTPADMIQDADNTTAKSFSRKIK